MEHYGFYIYTCYLITFVGLSLLILITYLERRRVLKMLKQKYQASRYEENRK